MYLKLSKNDGNFNIKFYGTNWLYKQLKGCQKRPKRAKICSIHSLNSGVLNPKKVFHRFDTSIETLGLNISEINQDCCIVLISGSK